MSTRDRSITVLAHSVRETGGMERTQFHVVCGLLERGWRVRVLAWRCDLQARPGLEVVRLPVPRRPFVVEQLSYAAAAETVLRLRPEPGIVSALGAIVPHRVDVITTQYVHHSAASGRVSTAAPGVAALARRSYASTSRALARGFEDLAYRPTRVRRVIAVSDALRRELGSAFPRLSDQVVVIPNGTDTTLFRPSAQARAAARERLGLRPEDLVAIFAGGDWVRKGLQVALEAVAASPPWRLLIIGEGDTSAYEARARELGIMDRVFFAGRVDDPERYFVAADAFVLPTAYEGFPLVSIEAAATGLPLLMTREANAEEVLIHGASGFVLSRSPEEFSEALRRLEADPVERRRLGEQARTAALRLDWAGIVDRHDAIYGELLETA